MSELIIKGVSLHHVDRDNDKIIHKNISVKDAQDYIKDLTDKMIKNLSVREYRIKSDPNPVIYSISDFISSFDTVSESAISLDSKDTPNLVTCYSRIANRLLEAQKIAQIKYKKLTEIKKGSIIQSLIELNNEYIYIIALVEHSGFIDESDLLRKIGLPDSSKAAYKTARIHLNKDLSIKNIYLSDTLRKISEYWYDSFLDLVECINNVTNTKYAYNFIKGMLKNKLSSKYKQDHLEYVQSLNAYFKHETSFDFNDCIDYVFSTDPISTELNIEEFKNEIKSKRDKLPFDATFDVDNSDIKDSLKDTKYKLNNNVELKIKASDDKIRNSVYTHRLENGKIILAISNVDLKELERFNFNNIDI